MGISAKWIKSLVGLRKHEKGRNAESSVGVSHCAAVCSLRFRPRSHGILYLS
jgi:hypothetical protein